MKIRLTPLNIVSAMCLVFVVWLLVQEQPKGYIRTTGILVTFSLILAIAAFISDLVFRKFIPSLKKIWVVEGMLVVFIVILIFIIKASF